MPIFLSEPQNTNTDNTLTSNAINLGTGLEDIEYLYVRCKGVEDDDIETAIQITGFDISIIGLAVVDGADGYQYIIYDHERAVSGDFEATFFGSSIEIDKIYLFKKLFDFPDDDTFVRLDMGSTERGAIIHEDLYYDYSKVKGRIKRSVAYTAEFQTLAKYRQFELFRDANPHFYFLEDYAFFPERLYPAILGRNVETVYTIQNKLEGININFDITER